MEYKSYNHVSSTQETMLQFDICYKSSISTGNGGEESLVFFLYLSNKSVCNAVRMFGGDIETPQLI